MPANDPLAPKSTLGDAFAGPVSCVTLISNDADATDRFYVDVLEMAGEKVQGNERDRQLKRRLWGLPEGFDWQERIYWRPSLPAVARLRVLVSEQAEEPVRPDLTATLEGGLSIGFAMRDLDAVVQRGETLGFLTTAGIGALDMQRADGSPYQALECHFHAPDDVYALGVGRPADLAPVGPIEDGKTVGGPSYTGQVMNHCERTLRFYTEVLGYEVRRSMEIGGPVAEKGLGLAPGTTMQFMQVFAPGSTSGYFIVLDFGDDGQANDAVAPPHRGVIMWTIPVKNVDTVAKRCESFDCSVLGGPLRHDTPALGSATGITIRTANGFLVECVEAAPE